MLIASTAVARDLALLDAVRSGNTQAARMLIAGGADVNAASPDGMTALHWAVRADDLPLVDRLLRAGAHADLANRLGVTPLELATTNGSAPMLKRLIAAGADPHALLPEGETLLMRAARTGRVDALKVLLAHGLDPNARETTLGETALIWAAAENHGGAVRLLIESGAAVDARSAQRSDVELKRMRRVRGVVTRGGWTPLMYAARQGAVDAIHALADGGASLDLTNSEGTNAVVLAIINGHFDVAAVLLDLGASPNIADQSGMAALYAIVDMHTLPWMKGRPAPKPSERVDAVALAKQLLARGADPNARLKAPILMRHQTRGDNALGDGSTPFLRAAKSGDVLMMRLLLAHGADPFAHQQDGANALMLAAGLGWRTGDADANDTGTDLDAIAAIALCLELGLDVDAVDYRGATALHYAVDRSDEIVTYLAGRGAKLTIEDYEGRTPLDIASRGINAEARGGYVRDTTAPLLKRLIDARP
jgi:ankyrin repeat protein